MRVAAALVVLSLLAGCGGGGKKPALVSETVGRGAQSATIIRPDSKRALPVVVFLHGWGATQPRFYRPWLDHLAREGNAVIYPRYQDSFVDPPAQALGNVLTGVRLALGHVRERPRTLVVAGHSAGGALAADYAAIARMAKLPEPVAVFSVYPGRRLRRLPFAIPEIDPRRIAPATRGWRLPAPATPSSATARRGGWSTAREHARSAWCWWTTPPPLTTLARSAPTLPLAASSGRGRRADQRRAGRLSGSVPPQVPTAP